MGARTEVLRFLMLLGPARSPVTGCRFSFSAVVKVAFFWDIEFVVDVRTLIVLTVLGFEGLLDGASWNTVKVRRDIAVNTRVGSTPTLNQQISYVPRAINTNNGQRDYSVTATCRSNKRVAKTRVPS